MEKAFTEQVKQFGLTIKRIREAKRWSQQELSARCNIDIRTIQRIERGEYGVGLYILFGLAAAFEIAPAELLVDIQMR